MKPLTFGSLFAGIGGFDLGFERAGMVCKWQVEIDPFCQRVLAKHWPHVRRHDDVRTFPPTAADDWRVDVICGGFPCQDISNAGLRAGIEGERSGLWSEYARIIRVLRPTIVCVENVAALLDRGIGRVLGDLATLGYCAEWECFTAAEFNAPHQRDRLFILANSNENANLDALRAGTRGQKSEGFAWWRGRLDELGASDGIERRDTYAEVMREVDGIPAWVDRVGGLGNAVVPQVAEWIGRRIVEASQRDSIA